MTGLPAAVELAGTSCLTGTRIPGKSLDRKLCAAQVPHRTQNTWVSGSDSEFYCVGHDRHLNPA